MHFLPPHLWVLIPLASFYKYCRPEFESSLSRKLTISPGIGVKNYPPIEGQKRSRPITCSRGVVSGVNYLPLRKGLPYFEEGNFSCFNDPVTPTNRSVRSPESPQA